MFIEVTSEEDEKISVNVNLITSIYDECISFDKHNYIMIKESRKEVLELINKRIGT
jgi:hypothetical protein